MKVPFLELKPTYDELRNELDTAYHRVMESGWYLLGQELETFARQMASALCTLGSTLLLNAGSFEDRRNVGDDGRGNIIGFSPGRISADDILRTVSAINSTTIYHSGSRNGDVRKILAPYQAVVKIGMAAILESRAIEWFGWIVCVHLLRGPCNFGSRIQEETDIAFQPDTAAKIVSCRETDGSAATRRPVARGHRCQAGRGRRVRALRSAPGRF